MPSSYRHRAIGIQEWTVRARIFRSTDFGLNVTTKQGAQARLLRQVPIEELCKYFINALPF